MPLPAHRFRLVRRPPSANSRWSRLQHAASLLSLRGMTHARANAVVNQTPENSEPAAIGEGLGLRLQQFALAELVQAQRLLSRSGEKRHRGVHEGRKCLRRARATLALAASALGSGADALDDALAQICRGLSSLRDAQALTEALSRLRLHSSTLSESGLDAALSLARARRDAVLARTLERDPGLAKRRARLQRAGARLARLDWSSVSERGVRKALQRSQRRIDRAQARVQHHPHDDEHWHALRRRIRRLRQQHTLLAQAAPGWLAPIPADFERHAVALGRSQDDALLLAQCGRGSPFPPALRGEIRALTRQRLHASRHRYGQGAS